MSIKIEHIRSGKVRDIYTYDEEGKYLLFVTSNRVSAFDVVLPNIIPTKGYYLNKLSEFWMDKFADMFPNHLTYITPPTALDNQVRGIMGYDPSSAIVVKKLEPLPVECIVRQYLIGSGYTDYMETGKICGIDLPSGLRIADRLPKVIFTPSTKAETGHDKNISFWDMIDIIDDIDKARSIKLLSIAMFIRAQEYANKRGLIIADTKFEFGVDEDGVIHLIDEVLTPDSSRYWNIDDWNPGTSPPSFDKQIIRDYLESIKWDKKPPAPKLPDHIIDLTVQRYAEVLHRLTFKLD